LTHHVGGGGTTNMRRCGLLFDDPNTLELGRGVREPILELASDGLKAATL